MRGPNSSEELSLRCRLRTRSFSGLVRGLIISGCAARRFDCSLELAPGLQKIFCYFLENSDKILDSGEFSKKKSGDFLNILEFFKIVGNFLIFSITFFNLFEFSSVVVFSHPKQFW